MNQRLLDKLGIPLIIKTGEALTCFSTLIEESKADTIYWNRCYDPVSIPRDTRIKQRLSQNMAVKTFNASLLYEPWEVGEDAALQKLTVFINERIANYQNHRNNPHITGTSSLSPHLHFGEISPRQIVNSVIHYRDQHPHTATAYEVFLKEIVWRDFAYYLLYHFPQTVDEPLDSRFIHFPWIKEQAAYLQAWQRGLTGIPIVDAGMRELWHTGWMHNRVRMIVASFLTKNLLIPWQEGEHWFRDTLLDADLASNVFGWQWAADSGADAAPYFRIFNPVLQSEKFDKEGEYIRRWIPELSELDSKTIHHPKQAINGYPAPIVDLKATRQRALDAFASIKNTPKN